MRDKELRKLSRTELLELLVELGRENIALQERLARAEAELADRRMQLQDCGSIAEAALKLSGIFEAAQQAADLYTRECRLRCDEMLRDAQQQTGVSPPDDPDDNDADGAAGEEDA